MFIVNEVVEVWFVIRDGLTIEMWIGSDSTQSWEDWITNRSTLTAMGPLIIQSHLKWVGIVTCTVSKWN